MNKEETLGEALSSLGIDHTTDVKTDMDGRRTWIGADGIIIGRFTWYEGWKEIIKFRTRVEGQRLAPAEGGGK